MDTFFQSLKILLVDDEQFIRQLISRLLRDMGVNEVLVARDGHEAMRVMAANPARIDLMILDLEMPSMNGLKVLENIRKGEAEVDAKLPVIILTGHSDEKSVTASVVLGVHGFLVKPVSKTSLTKRIRSAIGGDFVSFNKFA